MGGGGGGEFGDFYRILIPERTKVFSPANYLRTTACVCLCAQWNALPQKQEGQYPSQTSAERKEALYLDIINYFDKGKVRLLSGIME